MKMFNQKDKERAAIGQDNVAPPPFEGVRTPCWPQLTCRFLLILTLTTSVFQDHVKITMIACTRAPINQQNRAQNQQNLIQHLLGSTEPHREKWSSDQKPEPLQFQTLEPNRLTAVFFPLDRTWSEPAQDLQLSRLRRRNRDVAPGFFLSPGNDIAFSRGSSFLLDQSNRCARAERKWPFRIKTLWVQTPQKCLTSE